MSDNRFPQMLYRAPGSEAIHGGTFDTAVVKDEAEYKAARADGFHDRTDLATAALHDAQAVRTSSKPSRESLEARAKKLGIEFKPSTSDKALTKAIDEKSGA